MAKLGVAVHGAGWVSGEHIKAYTRNPHTEVRVISSRNERNARARMEETGVQCDYTSDLADAVKRDDIAIVSLCTPPHVRPQEVVTCARAGKHILLEKPIAVDLAGLKTIRDAVRRAKVKTIVGFVLHWNPYFQTVKALIADGTLGKIFEAETDYFHEIGPWWSGYPWAVKKETGGSPMLLGGCHAVDAIRWFVGSEVVEVFAYKTRGHRKDFEYEPSQIAVLRFKNGCIGKVGASFEMDMPYVFNVFLHGANGVVRNEKLYSKERFPGLSGFMTLPTIMPDSGHVSHHPFQGEIDHLVDCILKDKEAEPNVEDAVKTHEVCLAIDMSAAQGKPVRLPLVIRDRR
jgi:predicted dehydrogenase